MISFVLLLMNLATAIPTEGRHQGTSLAHYTNTTMPWQSLNLTKGANLTIGTSPDVMDKTICSRNILGMSFIASYSYAMPPTSPSYYTLNTLFLPTALLASALSVALQHTPYDGGFADISSFIVPRIRVPFMATCPDRTNAVNTAFYGYTDIYRALTQVMAMLNGGFLGYSYPKPFKNYEKMPVNDCRGPMWEFPLLQNGLTLPRMGSIIGGKLDQIGSSWTTAEDFATS